MMEKQTKNQQQKKKKTDTKWRSLFNNTVEKFSSILKICGLVQMQQPVLSFFLYILM